MIVNNFIRFHTIYLIYRKNI